MTTKECLKCGGSGEVIDRTMLSYPCSMHSDKCPDCTGSGEREGKTPIQNAFRYAAADLTVQDAHVREKMENKNND